jgi:hypothetical protein
MSDQRPVPMTATAMPASLLMDLCDLVATAVLVRLEVQGLIEAREHTDSDLVLDLLGWRESDTNPDS